MHSPTPEDGLALIGCDVFAPEIEAFRAQIPNLRTVELLPMGLHDRPAELREQLLLALQRAEEFPGVQWVIFAYALCGNGLVGVGPRRCRMVLPRAHDCIAVLLGGREHYRSVIEKHPGAYFYSPGWVRGKRVPGPDRPRWLRELYADRYDDEMIEELIEVDRECYAHNDCALYVDLVEDESARSYCQECAQALGWKYAHHPGDPRLFQDLMKGPWDKDRFLVLEPGWQVAVSSGEDVIKGVPFDAR